MKHLTPKLYLCLAAALLLAGCEAEIDGSLDKDADPGSADFSSFVAVGDSLTAGYADGALYRDGQKDSYPAILASRFDSAEGGAPVNRGLASKGGGIAFSQPLMPKNATGSLTLMGFDLGRDDRLVFTATGDPDTPVTPVEIMPSKPAPIDVRLAGAGGYNNMGVPGAKSFHLLAPGYGELALAAMGVSANPYFARFASSDATSMIADAAGQVPTFFILWIGNNDILLYALDGGGTNNSVPPYGMASVDVTDPTVFAGAYNGALMTLKTPTNKGVLVSVPDVSTIPYFTTVPYDAIPLKNSDVTALTDFTDAYGVILDLAVGAMQIDADEAERRRINYKKGQNPILISDESLTDLGAYIGGLPLGLDAFTFLAQARPATKNDFILLTTAAKLGEEATPGNPLTKWGVTLPLADADALIDFEYDQVEVARKAYNMTIKAAANADPDLAFYDAAARLKELNKNGLSYGSGGVTSAFFQGGFFSADGIHPTSRGYAVVANEIMAVIEDAFGATLPPVDPGQYSTVFLDE